MKTNTIRLIDVWAISPILIAGGLILEPRRPLLGLSIFAIGVATAIYNGQNYLQSARKPPVLAQAGPENGTISEGQKQ